jgi:hypothetical protein
LPDDVNINSFGKVISVEWREQFQERLDNLDTLSPDALASLEAELVELFDQIDKDNGSLTDLNEISATISSVREAKDARTDDLAALRSQVHPAEDSEPEGKPDTSADDDVPGADDDSEDEDDEPDVAPTQVAASTRPRRPSLSQVASRRTPQSPSVPRLHGTSRVVAAGDIPGFGVGQEITNSDQLSMALMRKLQALGRSGTPDDVLVASVIKEFPDDRQLGGDPGINTRKMNAATQPQSLVAYGGICQPLTVDYTIDTIGSTERPVKAGLPSFGATRGGVSFFQPPVLSSITPPVPWTVAMDTAGTAKKACMRVTCKTATSAEVYGIPVCIEVGNMMGKYNPEQINAQTALLDVATARMAELTLLNGIDTGSTAVTSTGVLGATRTILPTMDQLISAYKYRYRLGSATLRVCLPDWVKDLIRADMAMELAHDRDGQDNLAITDAQIASWFSARQCSPIWSLEDLAGTMGAAQAAGALNPWPADFVGYFFAEGTWQFLDGGQIDVGVVRDSTLNSTNDYQIWREDFEGLAKRGNESLKVTVTTAPTGQSAGSVDTTAGP